MSTLVEIVSEIGINWDGDFELLTEMINKSSEAGCDAIKLQAFRESRVIIILKLKDY